MTLTRSSEGGHTVGYAVDGAVGWLATMPWVAPFCVRGAPEAAAKLLKQVFRAGIVGAGSLVRLPRVPPAVLNPLAARHHQDWLFLAIDHTPPAQAYDEDVVALPPESEGEVAAC